MRKGSTRLLGVVTIGVALIAAYGACYASLVARRLPSVADTSPTPTLPLSVPPRYRVGSSFVRLLFAPAHWLDRKLRRRHWNITETEGLVEVIQEHVGPSTPDGMNAREISR
jgi:hypothetical protein